MVEKVGYKHEEQEHLERRESLGWITGAHTVPTGCFPLKSGTEPGRCKGLSSCSAEEMCHSHGVSGSCFTTTPLLLSITVGRELNCRLRGLNAATGACCSIDASPHVTRPFSKIIFR